MREARDQIDIDIRNPGGAQPIKIVEYALPLVQSPNGRRLADDVTDITLRVAVGGVLAGNLCGANHTSACNVFPNNVLGDGVNVNDVNEDLAPDGVTNLVEPNTHFHTTFPYVDYAPSGRDRKHIDPGGSGCNINPGGICATN